MDTLTAFTYEQPLCEQLRLCLRLEYIFQQMAECSPCERRRDCITYLSALVDAANILERSDFGTSTAKALSRYGNSLSHMACNPGVDPKRLGHFLDSIDSVVDELLFANSRINKAFRQNERFNTLRQHLNVHGNNCAFDTPAYRFWLNQPLAVQQKHLQTWASLLAPIKRGVALMLKLTRESTSSRTEIAQSGFYQQALNTQTPCQLIQITLGSSHIYPQISGSKHRIAIRFYNTDNPNSASEHAHKDVEFELRCCTL